MNARVSGYAETYARWQCDPEDIGGVLRAKGARLTCRHSNQREL
jgi:hypothetical protein